MKLKIIPLLILGLTLPLNANAEQVRARDIGIKPGILATGKNNAITDVDGVLVGHVTLNKGDSIRTGATAILPHGGNIYQKKVPAAAVIGNGFGKMMGYTQIHELGEIETPIVLTNTLNVPRAADAILDWTLNQDGNERVRSVNTIVGETNDAGLNDIRGRHLTPEIIIKAIEDAKSGPVEEGDVGAGKGTVAFGWKGGIGTSSRKLPEALGGYTVGVLVQSNYGGVLTMDGVPVGEELNQYYLQDYVDSDTADGSIMMIVATDAPLGDRNLERLGDRAMTGLARTGSAMTNGSGDYVIAFSTAESVRRTPERRNENAELVEIPNNNMSPLFQAVAEATEEAIYNSMLMARTVTTKDVRTGNTRTIHELPVDKVREILKKYGR
ncbi:P1 family peptidase [Pseudemcibacter aquimaris]|uniref:P1 family peptidase n=1 Tax=Pseudemcibacter aquimaris TaxID=2857064 RepID=UPI0020125D6C|nr:P1 family peptidase [Pseudemcibacter aquimaris]MCC3861596.1 P1 family peptidase [Pseudemcibacter aquimaris]WDU58365.1 P1 family peptidase [Pseudemcibacter aquimaris]